ncbi:beta strand repeat-containing protein [Methanobrevibacter sp. UBA412]|jgi:hypothetical protein|uniref:beta strand repeat-containing protein n=1 Tax=Methanobrevibacter sp. UBA412 TaxID=1915486 RepID=UPI0039B8E639
MFSKNIKTLSLFLVLAAVMIIAVGAVSAAVDVEGTGTPGDGIVTGNASNVNAAGTITGTVTVNDAAANSTTDETNNATKFDKDAGTQVTAGTGIYTKDANDAYVVVDSGSTFTQTTGTTDGVLTDAGEYTITGTIADTNNKLVNGQTYYLKVTAPQYTASYAGTTGAYTFNYLATAVDKYVPFTYTESSIVLDNNASTINYNDSWSFSGTLTDANGKPIVDNVEVTITDNADSAKTATGNIQTDANGKFTITSDTWTKYLTTGDLNTGDPLTVQDKNYTLTFTYGTTPNIATASANLNVTNKNGKVNVVLNDTNINFGDVITINATIVDANGKLMNVAEKLTANLINQATGKEDTVTLSPSTDGTDVYTGATKNTLPAGVYYITVTGTKTNYDINASDVNLLTVNKVATNIKGNDTIYTTGDALAVDDSTFIKLVSNTTTGKTDVSGSWTAVLYKADGTPLKSVTFNTADKAATNTINANQFKGLADGSYYVVINFAADNYLPSNTTVNIVVKQRNTITVENPDLKYDFGTTGNDTYLNITSDKVMNTTVEVFLGNESLGNVAIKDGKASIDFGALSKSAGVYNVTIVYAGDDTYLPFNATAKLTVVGKNIGNLNTNATTINGVTINSVNKTFTLNLTNSTKDLVNYTGTVKYYVGNELAGTINMVEGKVVVDANTLKGLTLGANKVTFVVDNNVTSKNVTVTINTKQLTSDIISNNVSTNNATPITITGTIVNATEGTVKVSLKDAKNNTIATVTGNVAADGTFTVAFGNYANGVYTAEINYTSVTELSSVATKNVTVTVNGTAPTPVVGNVTTNLTINTNFTEAYGEGLNLTGKLTDANGNPIVGQHIALNLTNPANGASKIYWVTTDTNGEYQLQINLFVGSYTASASFAGFTTADNKTYYLPSGPANGTITVTNGTEPVDNRTATVLAFSNFTEKYGQALNFTGTLKTTDGTPIIGQKIGMVLSNAAGQSKLYWRTTDSAGEVQLPIELFAGDYTFKCYFEGDSTYQPSNNQTGSITVTA